MNESIIFKLGTDNSGLNTGLEQAKGQVSSFASSTRGMLAGAISLGGIAAGIKSIVGEFARIDDLAKRFDTSAESIQRISYAAEQSGASAEMLMKSLTALTVAANKGDESFAKLGISASEFSNASPEKQIEMLAKAFDSAQGDGARTADMFELLGTRAADLVPMLRDGREEFVRLMNDAPAASDQAVAALAAADDFLGRILAKSKAWAAEALGAIGRTAAILGAATGGTRAGEADRVIGEAEKRAEEAKAQAAANAAAEAEEARHQAKMEEIRRKGRDASDKLNDVERELQEKRIELTKELSQAQKNATEERIAELENERAALKKTVEAENERVAKYWEDVAKQAAQQRSATVNDLADINQMSADERRQARRDTAERQRAIGRAERELDGQPEPNRNGVRDVDPFKTSDPRRRTNLDPKERDRAAEAEAKREKVGGKTLDQDVTDIKKILDERLPRKTA